MLAGTPPKPPPPLPSPSPLPQPVPKSSPLPKFIDGVVTSTSGTGTAVGEAVFAVITLAMDEDGEDGLRSTLVFTFFSSSSVFSLRLYS